MLGPKVQGVYLIRNEVNGKYYVGSSKNLRRRWTKHLGELRDGTHANDHLLRAFKKYGEMSFTFEVLEEVPAELDLSEREQSWLDLLEAAEFGYNILSNAYSRLGYKASEETKAKQSLALTGKKRSQEEVEAITRRIKEYYQNGGQPWNKGKVGCVKHSAESRRRMSETRKGHPVSEATRLKISQSHMGMTHSEETRKRMSELHKGRPSWNKGKPMSPETRLKLSEAKKGVVFSEEHRRKLGEVRKGTTHSVATRKKMSDALKRYYAEKRSRVNDSALQAPHAS